MLNARSGQKKKATRKTKPTQNFCSERRVAKSQLEQQLRGTRLRLAKREVCKYGLSDGYVGSRIHARRTGARQPGMIRGIACDSNSIA